MSKTWRSLIFAKRIETCRWLLIFIGPSGNFGKRFNKRQFDKVNQLVYSHEKFFIQNSQNTRKMSSNQSTLIPFIFYFFYHQKGEQYIMFHNKKYHKSNAFHRISKIYQILIDNDWQIMLSIKQWISRKKHQGHGYRDLHPFAIK